MLIYKLCLKAKVEKLLHTPFGFKRFKLHGHVSMMAEEHNFLGLQISEKLIKLLPIWKHFSSMSDLPNPIKSVISLFSCVQAVSLHFTSVTDDKIISFKTFSAYI